MEESGERRIRLALIAAAKQLGETTFVVIGSQAFYGGKHRLSPGSVVESADVDILPPGRISLEEFTRIHGVIGSESEFHEEHGFYVDLVQPDTPKLPEGWQERTTTVELGNELIRGERRTIYATFPDLHDLTAAKLVIGRENDHRFLADMVAAGLLDENRLRASITSTLRASEGARGAALNRVTAAFARAPGRAGES
jgi:hypothetical protein